MANIFNKIILLSQGQQSVWLHRYNIILISLSYRNGVETKASCKCVTWSFQFLYIVICGLLHYITLLYMYIVMSTPLVPPHHYQRQTTKEWRLYVNMGCLPMLVLMDIPHPWFPLGNLTFLNWTFYLTIKWWWCSAWHG